MVMVVEIASSGTYYQTISARLSDVYRDHIVPLWRSHISLHRVTHLKFLSGTVLGQSTSLLTTWYIGDLFGRYAFLLRPITSRRWKFWKRSLIVRSIPSPDGTQLWHRDIRLRLGEEDTVLFQINVKRVKKIGGRGCSFQVLNSALPLIGMNLTQVINFCLVGQTCVHVFHCVDFAVGLSSDVLR